MAGIFLRPQLRGHAAAESGLRQIGASVRHQNFRRGKASRCSSNREGCARARRSGADRFQSRAGRHGLSDGGGRRGAARHDSQAQSAGGNGRGRIKIMLHTIVVYVENKPGVLSRVVSLFRRRAFNIDSLTVGRTENPEVSRMTIVTDADEDQARRIVANVYKLVNVLLVDDVTGQGALMRDLTLVKVGAGQDTRGQVFQLAEVFRAHVLDIAADSITLEMTGEETKVDRFLELLAPYGLMEMVRTGVVAMRRGAKSPNVAAKAARVGTTDHDTVSDSV